MSNIAPEIWIRLGNERPQGESLWARRAAPDTSERLIAALDADENRHLLVLLMPSEADMQDSQSRGVGVVTRELVMHGHQSGRYLDITCYDAAGHEALDLIGGELAERLASGNESATEVVTRVLAKWRRFWGQMPKQILSHNEQLGLFAEIWFLCVWLIPRIGAVDGVHHWRGPYGARHDFEWLGKSIEVKATTSTRGRIHHINGLDQLTPPENGQLLLFSLRLREEAGATNTLPSVIAACRLALQADPEALGNFEDAIAHAGYLPAHEDEYSRLRLRIVEEGLFRVEDNFPRLTPANFSDGILNGIERVEYEVNLSGHEHLMLAASAAAMPNL